jgi:hypothetical protein
MTLKEKMMDGMMGNMSKEEKKEMMDKMMENFFADMSPEEKQKMMQDMMSKMMGSFMGSGENENDKENKGEKHSMMDGKSNMMDMMKMMMGGKSPMMNMMKMMMGGKSPMMGMDSDGKGEKPWDMCQKMMSSISKSSEIATFATPEIRGLFEEWIQQIEEEFITFIKSSGTDNVEKLQEHFKLSKDSVIYFLTRLSQKGKIKFKIDSE